MQDNNSKFNQVVSSMFVGLDQFASSKTVVGDPMRFEDGTILVPLMDVSFGMGAGAFGDSSKNQSGGMGGKISASSILVLKDGTSRLISVKGGDGLSKIVDMVPDLINKFSK